MRTIETTAVVTPDHTITVKLPEDMPAGQYDIVVVMTSAKTEPDPGFPYNLQPIDIGPWPEEFTASPEQLYGDDGR